MRASTARITDDKAGQSATLRARRSQRAAWLVRRAAVIGLFGVAAHCTAPLACAQAVDQSVINREYQIKAAFLYNFGRDAYIRWPQEALGDESDPFVIGILGRDPFGNNLMEIARHKKVKGRRLIVRRFATIEQYDHCHILFVSRFESSEQQLRAIRQTADQHVLVVGESPGFAEKGGSINFYVERNKIRFEINLESARHHDLTISSRLLSVARIIGGQ